jgi:hypothetical protein
VRQALGQGAPGGGRGHARTRPQPGAILPNRSQAVWLSLSVSQ